MTVQASNPVPFGEWLPDMGQYETSGALVAYNCIPYGQKYKPFSSLSEATDALPSKCKGGFSYIGADGTVSEFAGTATGLYKLNGTSWDDVSRTSGGAYSLGEDNFWQFVSFGTLVIATNYVDDIQCFDTSVDTVFSQMSSTAPRARIIAVVKNFLVCVDTVDGDGAIPYRVRWSPIGDPKGTWGSFASTTQSDFQDIYGGGFQNTFVSPYGEYGVIIQDKSIWRMDYIGGDKIFSITIVNDKRGSLLPRSCVYNGESIFFIGEDGFYELRGGDLIPIGDKKTDKEFYSDFDETYDFNLNVCVDPLRKLVIWAFPDDTANDGTPNLLICFNWVDRKFSLISEETEFILSFISVGYTLEGLDAISTDLDALPFSLDSRAWAGGKTSLGAFSSNHKLGVFNGATKTAIIQTEEIRPNGSGRSTIHSVIPNIEGGSIRGRIGCRPFLSSDIWWTDFVDMNIYNGELDFMMDVAFVRCEVEISDDWVTAHSVSYRAEIAGAA